MNASFVIMGLPASGKTTFLAALWHLVESGETECRLVMDHYRGDFTYLNNIADAWRNFKKVPRTSQIGDTDVTIYLHDRVTGARGTALFPDLAGEIFDLQVEERRCRPEFVVQADADDGILFFVNADVKEDGLSIVDLNARLPQEVAATVLAGESPQALGGVNASAVAPEWEPKLLPAQVRIVQLLSDLLRPPFTYRTRKLALLISAWDLVRDQGSTPEQWLARTMPLVSQFLRTNGISFTHKVYGVSAQGIRLDDDAAVDGATKIAPSRRVQIVGHDGEGHDLTAPLVWLMSAAE
ncbi:TRAFAC clade GTPase domain-containing protein [Aeromonas salmonicida]|jgi:hypothetical protein|uniref:TRAFAC clade GTPase domain-containing protein n=1 Tax=Aeromonas TaxID=642 RepID=UPI0007C6B33E|nr:MULTISPECIES: hypothetical protein [Aeromonas]MBJ7583937.1 hypothetical protein [Aeromonas veronii]OAH81091.1 hypothetical protein AXW81_02245 [Aeromonas salmonicida subsp. salmonicida]BBU06976.1 hypothetical protein WP9W18E04_P10630 [Aeromonas veronii]